MFPNKSVAIINKDLEPGRALNAVAHMSVALGAEIGENDLLLDDYIDNNGFIYPKISRIPFIILRAKSSEIRKIYDLAKEHDIKHRAFLDTMIAGTFVQQIERTAETNQENLVFFGLNLFGDWSKVSELTKKLSLYK
ncbi:MAG: DUF2000 domain-containing protein [Sphingobacteriia bacterium]|nr:DUF2000 domain-containing protein [Sphingobacteriia bacterium]